MATEKKRIIELEIKMENLENQVDEMASFQIKLEDKLTGAYKILNDLLNKTTKPAKSKKEKPKKEKPNTEEPPTT